MNIDSPVSPRVKRQNVDVDMFKYFDLDRDRSSSSNALEMDEFRILK